MPIYMLELVVPPSLPCQLFPAHSFDPASPRIPSLEHLKQTPGSSPKIFTESLSCSLCARTGSSLSSLPLRRPSLRRTILPSSQRLRLPVRLSPYPFALAPSSPPYLANSRAPIMSQTRPPNVPRIPIRLLPSSSTTSRRYGNQLRFSRVIPRAKRCGRKSRVAFRTSRLKANSMEAPLALPTIP